MSPKVLGISLLAALALAAPLQARQAAPTSSANSSPPDGRILGIVVDEDQKPVAGALVMLGDGRTTETGTDGRFSFVRVQPGTHEIAAVTSNCAMAAGGFSVQSGRDALLQLIVEPQITASAQEKARSRGTSIRRMEMPELQAMVNRSALDAVEQLASNLFEVEGSRLALRARGGSATNRVTEPLLLVDGMRYSGMVADALRSMRATDLASIEIHLGNAAGWEFQNNGAPAVIEVTTRTEAVTDPLENPRICLAKKGR